MEEKHNKLRSEIETSYNQEIKEQLCLNNTALMSTIDQHFSAFKTVMLQTVKDLEVISTKNQPSSNTPFTHDQSKSNPIHNQPSNIHPSPIIHPQHHLQYNHTTLNTNQLNMTPLLISHQQQIAYVNVSRQFQLNSTNPTYQQITHVSQQHSCLQQSLTNSPIHHQHNQNTSHMQQSLVITPPPSPHTQPSPSSPLITNLSNIINEA